MKMSSHQQMHHIFAWAATLAIMAIISTPSTIIAQDNGIIATPSPAPSKTPDITIETTTTAELETTETARVPVRSLTQADLSILTGNVQRPNGISWLDGQLFVSCTGDWTIYQIDATSSQTLTYIYGIRNAHTLHAETDEDGEIHIWVPDFQANTLNDVTRNGIRTVTNELSGPWGMVSRDENSFLITNLSANSLTSVNRDGEITTLVEGLRAPTGVAVDGTLAYVANNGSTRRAIEWYDLSEPTPTQAPDDGAGHTLVSGLQNVTGLTLAEDNYLYFAFSLGTRGVVGRVDPITCRENGGCGNDEIEIVLLTELAAPLSGLTISPDGKLYVHTMFSPDIYWAQLPGFAPTAET
jgi:hypothetical protein